MNIIYDYNMSIDEEIVYESRNRLSLPQIYFMSLWGLLMTGLSKT